MERVPGTDRPVQTVADRHSGYWWRWPTRREWLIIVVSVGWPAGLYLHLAYGDRRLFREFAGLASLVVCSALLLGIRSWQIPRFWLLFVILGYLRTPVVGDFGDNRFERYFIGSSIIGLFVGLVWNDIWEWFRATRRD